ncbi:MAG: dihydropteroate synthase [Acidiferrobacter sp.]
MGILNVTPDSFSDGGLFLRPEEALVRVAELVAAGADMVDVGGESTRPGAAPVTAAEECARVIPVITAIRRRFSIPISIDTSEPTVMVAAVAAGANRINDVRALRRPGALAAAAALRVPVCLMHAKGEPGIMQLAPHYDDVVAEVRAFLVARLAACVVAGIDPLLLAVDPGFGFGKSLAHNLTLLRGLDELAMLAPLVVGLSRKNMTGAPFNLGVQERCHTSVAMALAAVHHGARVVRAHDIRPTYEALRAWELVFEPKECEA